MKDMDKPTTNTPTDKTPATAHTPLDCKVPNCPVCAAWPKPAPDTAGRDAEERLLQKLNKAIREKDADAFLAAIEESKPAPDTAEWTVTDRGLCIDGEHSWAMDYDKAEAILAAHKAALAAERHYWQGVATQEWHKGFATGTEQLAAEREKYERSQEKVREYFDLLAAEREKWLQANAGELLKFKQLREQLDAAVKELKRLDAWCDERRNAPDFTTLGMVQVEIARAFAKIKESAV
jgi:hypothetical protein